MRQILSGRLAVRHIQKLGTEKPFPAQKPLLALQQSLQGKLSSTSEIYLRFGAAIPFIFFSCFLESGNLSRYQTVKNALLGQLNRVGK